MTHQFAINIDPLLPLWALALICAFLLLFLMLIVLRRKWYFLLRSGVIGLTILALLDPAIMLEERKPLSTIIALIHDQSASQKLDQRPAMTEQAITTIRQELSNLQGIDMEEITITNDQKDGTFLFEAMNERLSTIAPDRLGGIILVSDGQIHDVPEPVLDNGNDLRFQAPFHALITGHRGEFDRRLSIVDAPRFMLVGQTQKLQFHIHDEGAITAVPNRARLSLSRNGTVLEERVVTTGQDIALELRVENAGKTVFELAIAPVEGELTHHNNRAIIEVDAVREALRVLLVSGEPHAGERTWRNLLKSDAAVDLVHFTILRPPEKQDGTPINELSLIAFPTRQLFDEKIDDFDLIIFDRYHRRGVLPMLYFDNIVDYVRQGGAILVAAGPEYAGRGSIWQTSLGRILPARPTGDVIRRAFIPQLSQNGLKHPVTTALNSNPSVRQSPNPDQALTDAEDIKAQWSAWFRYVDAVKNSGTSLMQTDSGQPLLVVDRFEKGRIALFLSDHVWLWGRNYDGGGPYIPLLRRLSHWLMQEPDLEEEQLRVQQQGSRLMIERQTMQDNVDDLRITRPDGREEILALTQIEAGRFSAQLSLADQDQNWGLWRFSQNELQEVLHFGPKNPREYHQVISTSTKLQPFMEQKNGSIRRLIDEALPRVPDQALTQNSITMPRIVFTSTNGPFSGPGWIGLQRVNASELEGVRRFSLYLGPLGLIILGLSWLFLWWREGRR